MEIALSTDTPLYQITLLASGGYFFPYAGTAASFTTDRDECLLLTGARMCYRLAYGRCAGKYRRYAWLELENGYSRWEESEEPAAPLDELFLLPADMFARENKVIASRLLFKEREFASKLEMEADMASPAPLNCDSFFHELFGDEEPDL